MTGQKIVKNVVKGLALGVLWPTAAVVVVTRRTSRWIGDVGTESLNMARTWEDGAEIAIKVGVNEARDIYTLKVNPPPTVSGGSQDAGENTETAIPAKPKVDIPQVTLMLATAGVAIALANVHLWLAIVWIVVVGISATVSQLAIINAGKYVVASSYGKH